MISNWSPVHPSIYKPLKGAFSSHSIHSFHQGFFCCFEATTFDAALENHCSSMRAILYPKLSQARLGRSIFRDVWVSNQGGISLRWSWGKMDWAYDPSNPNAFKSAAITEIKATCVMFIHDFKLWVCKTRSIVVQGRSQAVVVLHHVDLAHTDHRLDDWFTMIWGHLEWMTWDRKSLPFLVTTRASILGTFLGLRCHSSSRLRLQADLESGDVVRS